MTKSEIEKLIEYIDDNVPKMALEGNCYIDKESDANRWPIHCKLASIYDLLREYPVDPEKSCGPDYKAMYEDYKRKLEEALAHIESLKFDMHHLAVEHAHYTGAVAAMETIFGRKFEPNK